MFERRLKILLMILAVVLGGLALRAAQLQMTDKDYWSKEATDAMRRVHLQETTRGDILDFKKRVLATDRPCIDACVYYGALTRPTEPTWLKATALKRLRDRMGDAAYLRTSKDARKTLLVKEQKAVEDDIEAMFAKLAELSGKPLEEIEEIRQNIDYRVLMRRRYIWYRSYEAAVKKQGGRAPKLNLHKWLFDNTSEGPQLDNFDVVVGEQNEVHVVLHAVDTEVQNTLERHIEKYPGLVLRAGTHRYYPLGDVFCHAIGHLSRVTREDLTSDSESDDELRRYQPNDYIGRTGLEALCEPSLKGSHGKIEKLVGNETPVNTVDPAPGKNVRTTLDLDLQQEIQNFMASATVKDSHGQVVIKDGPLYGAAIVIDVKTNEVRALVSYPTYDLNQFDEKYAIWHDDDLNDPLRNRATQNQLEPGSTMKPVVGLAGIAEGVIGVNKGIECTGYFHNQKGKVFPMGRCWVASSYEALLREKGMTPAHHPVPYPHVGHDGNLDGYLTYSDALERSCNVYFETVADLLGTQKLSAWMERFGIGRHTGLGIEEFRGRLPRNAPPNLALGPMATLWFAGIGQGYVAATPIQMANVAATIARKGIWMRPRLIAMGDDHTLPALRQDLLADLGQSVPDRVDLHLPPAALEAARQGMINVVNSRAGTGTSLHRSDMIVAGKTGTAQASPYRIYDRDPVTHKIRRDEKGKLRRLQIRPSTTAEPNTLAPWYRGTGPEENQLGHSWFIGFAPADDPQIAFAVMVEYGGSGGMTAGAVAHEVLDSCIAHGYLKATKSNDEQLTSSFSSAEQ